MKNGYQSNKTEAAFYKKNPYKCLAPTYFNFFNLFLVSKRIEGNRAAWSEVSGRVWPILNEEEKAHWYGDHTALSADWIKTPNGIILVDYGSEESVVNKVLVRQGKKFEDALAN